MKKLNKYKHENDFYKLLIYLQNHYCENYNILKENLSVNKTNNINTYNYALIDGKNKKKQKKGKARAKQFGKVEIPQEAFIGVLKINKSS